MIASKAEQRQQTIDRITAWMKKHPGKWWRIPDIANAVSLPVTTVNAALHIMEAALVIERTTKRKRINGKKYPLYIYHSYEAPTNGPSWLVPQVPNFESCEIKGMITVLGFSGDISIKNHLKNTK